MKESVTEDITIENLPEGTWWDEKDGSWKAVILYDCFGGKEWYWQARNMKALESDKPIGKMLPYISTL